MNLNWNYWMGGGFKPNKNLCRGVWIFSATRPFKIGQMK